MAVVPAVATMDPSDAATQAPGPGSTRSICGAGSSWSSWRSITFASIRVCRPVDRRPASSSPGGSRISARRPLCSSPALRRSSTPAKWASPQCPAISHARAGAGVDGGDDHPAVVDVHACLAERPARRRHLDAGLVHGADGGSGASADVRCHRASDSSSCSGRTSSAAWPAGCRLSGRFSMPAARCSWALPVRHFRFSTRSSRGLA